MRWLLPALTALTAALAPLTSVRPQDATLPPTRVVTFTPPVGLPNRAAPGSCWTVSPAAWFRGDALRCTVRSVVSDPCFKTPRAGQVLCDVDPRDPSSGTMVTMTSKPVDPPDRSNAGQLAWLFELADGTTCRPLAAPGREVDGLVELYGCRYGAAGDADAVLGDLDTSLPVWTIRTALLNKKIDPPTIKSVTNAAVKTVWR